MLGVIRDHNMKIDGEISILLTNMLVLESIAKGLDPKINILRCMVPYLQYQWTLIYIYTVISINISKNIIKNHE